MKKPAPSSDQVNVLPAEEQIDWDLKLAAFASGEPQRTIRFLTAAVIACGGWVLSRSCAGSDTAEITFEFARAVSVEIYSTLIAVGLELSREAHIRITGLCQCTKELIDTRAYDIARIHLLVLPHPVTSELKREENPPGAKLS